MRRLRRRREDRREERCWREGGHRLLQERHGTRDLRPSEDIADCDCEGRDGQIRIQGRSDRWQIAMTSRTRFVAAVAGTLVVALCCFTPILVVMLAALGVAALTPYLDYVLYPSLAVMLLLSWRAYRLYTRERDLARPNPASSERLEPLFSADLQFRSKSASDAV